VREVVNYKVEFHHKKSQLMWTSHLFHRYNWCHVIDTIVIVQFFCFLFWTDLVT